MAFLLCQGPIIEVIRLLLLLILNLLGERGDVVVGIGGIELGPCQIYLPTLYEIKTSVHLILGCSALLSRIKG